MPRVISLFRNESNVSRQENIIERDKNQVAVNFQVQKELSP